MNKTNRYSPEFRERAVRMVLDQQDHYSSQWSANLIQGPQCILSSNLPDHDPIFHDRKTTEIGLEEQVCVRDDSTALIIKGVLQR